jgi:hypothetical protein
MKCIDAIEGTVKSILNQLYKTCTDDQLDDSEYIRYVKAVLDATDHYAQCNPEVVEGPNILQEVLYAYSRNLWLMGGDSAAAQPFGQSKGLNQESDDYQTYYYDFIFNKGIYPK